MPTRRQQRVSELLREELGLLVAAELDDPALSEALVAVTDVEISPDLRNARVYVEHALSPEKSGQVLNALRRSEGFLRRALLDNLNLRFVPVLSFRIDETRQRGKRIDDILDAMAAEQRLIADDESSHSD